MPRHRALIVGAFRPVAAAVIGRWIDAGHEVAAFWYAGWKLLGQRRRDRRLGWFAPHWSVSSLSRRHGFPLVQVPRLASWSDAVPLARATGADVLISVYFQNIVPPDLLALFPGRAVNFHPAPLPRHRGPNPVGAMVLDRSIKTDGAMTLHALSEGLDEGDIVAQTHVAFPFDRDLFEYHLALARAAGHMTADHLPRYLDGILVAAPQDAALASYHRPATRDMWLSAGQTADEIRWRCETFAAQTPLEIDGMERRRARGFRRTLGPPSGEPPRAGPFRIDFDARDARIRVARDWPLVRPWRRLRQFVRYRRAAVK